MSGVTSFLSVVRGGARAQPDRCYIIPLDVDKADEPVYLGMRYFQYFPETITDNKQSNWETKNIPGLSHPLYQWISGSAREITFTAIFTRDKAPTQAEKDAVLNGTAILQHGADSGSAARQSTAVTLQGTVSPNAFSDPRNVDIPSAVAWLKSFLYPEFTTSGATPSHTGSRPRPPRKMILGVPGLRMGIDNPSNSHPDEIVCIMLSAEASYEAFFADGSPRIAKVALTFAEIIQVAGKIQIRDAFALRSAGQAGYRLTTTGRENNRRNGK